MGPRGAGRRLNDQERMEILDIFAREAKVKNVDLAKRYGVSEGAIRKLKQMKDIIRDRYYMGNEQNRDKRKRGGFARNAKFEQELYEWICRMRESSVYQTIPLTQTAVRQQAMVLARNHESMANFKASPGWFARFCSRHRLDPPTHSLTTGGPPVDPSTVVVGDTVPASAYQVDGLAHLPPPGVLATNHPPPPAAATVGFVGDHHLVLPTTEAVGEAKADDVDLNCGEAMEEQAQLVAAAADAPMAIDVHEDAKMSVNVAVEAPQPVPETSTSEDPTTVTTATAPEVTAIEATGIDGTTTIDAVPVEEATTAMAIATTPSAATVTAMPTEPVESTTEVVVAAAMPAMPTEEEIFSLGL